MTAVVRRVGGSILGPFFLGHAEQLDRVTTLRLCSLTRLCPLNVRYPLLIGSFVTFVPKLKIIMSNVE